MAYPMERTTPEGFAGVGYRAVRYIYDATIPCFEISAQQMMPGDRITMLCHMGTEVLGSRPMASPISIFIGRLYRWRALSSILRRGKSADRSASCEVKMYSRLVSLEKLYYGDPLAEHDNTWTSMTGRIVTMRMSLQRLGIM